MNDADRQLNARIRAAYNRSRIVVEPGDDPSAAVRRLETGEHAAEVDADYIRDLADEQDRRAPAPAPTKPPNGGFDPGVRTPAPHDETDMSVLIRRSRDAQRGIAPPTLPYDAA